MREAIIQYDDGWDVFDDEEEEEIEDSDEGEEFFPLIRETKYGWMFSLFDKYAKLLISGICRHKTGKHTCTYFFKFGIKLKHIQ